MRKEEDGDLEEGEKIVLWINKARIEFVEVEYFT
jgi:hypothetical protein